MNYFTAYERRAKLTTNELERLKAQLVDQVEKYRVAIRGYSPEKMSRFGSPHLAKLEARVADVEQLLSGMPDVR